MRWEAAEISICVQIAEESAPSSVHGDGRGRETHCRTDDSIKAALLGARTLRVAGREELKWG